MCSQAKQVDEYERIKACNTGKKINYLKCHEHLNSPYSVISTKRERKTMRIALGGDIPQELAESLETITANAISTPHLHFSNII